MLTILYIIYCFYSIGDSPQIVKDDYPQVKNSMIFKTFDSDIDNISSKWGLFGKSFYDVSTDIEKRWNNVSKTLQSTNDYTLQNITNAWKMGNSNPIKFLADNEVVSILDRYNKALDSGAEATAKFLNSGTGNEFMDGFLKDLDGAPATMDKYKVATKNATMAQKSFSASTIVTKAAVLALNVAVSMGLSIALSALIKTISEIAQSEENLKDASRELGSELSNNASTIEDYKEKINDLKSVLSDSTSSFDDVSQARADLMVIQDELIKKFGTEKGVIEDITEAIYGQTDALDQLSKDAYYKAVDEFNQKTIGDKFVDWLTFGNTDDNRVQSNMDKMVRQMESSIYSLETTGNEVLDNLIAKSLGLTISSDTYGDGKHFTIYGELDEIQEKLTAIREMASDFDVSTGFKNNFTDISNDVNSLLESHQKLYEQYVLWEKILTDNPNNQYDEQYNLINQSKKAYDEAKKSGDVDAVQKATEEYSKALSSAIDLAMSNYDYDVASYFEDMYPDMQQMFSEWKFTLDFEPNTDGLKDKVSNSLIGLEGFSSEDIMAFNPNVATEEQINAYGELNNIASEYGLTLQGLINLLMQMGLIQSESYQQIVEQFGQDNVNKIAPEDLIFAYQIKNVGDMTFEEFQAEIQRLKDEASNPNEITVLNITQTVDQIDKQLKPALDSLGEAYKTIFEQPFNLENVDTVGIAKDLKDEFDELSEAGITIDNTAYEDFVKVLSDTSSTADDVKTAFNELATAITDVSISGTEDFEVLRKSLSDLGVVNDVELAIVSLAKNEEILRSAGLDLSTATQQDIIDFVSLYGEAENLSQAIQYLTYQKMLNAMTDMDTTEEVSNLLVLAKNAGITGEAISYLTELEILYQEISSGTLNADMMAEYQARADELVSLIKSSATEFKPKVKFTPTIDTKDLDKKAEDATKAAKEALEATLELYKTELDAGIIDLATYLKKCNDLLNDARDKAIITGKEYWDYQKEVTENQKDIYDKVLSAVTRRYDKEIDSIEKVVDSIEKQNDALEKQKSIMDGVINAIIRILDREIDSIDDIIDGIEKQNDALEEQQDKYDSALSAISKYLEKQKELVQANIDGVEKENDAIQDEIDGYDKLLNAVTLVMDAKREAIEADKQGIQDRIDALRDENDEAKKAYELEQAKLDLERLRSQRNKKLYVEGQGYIYDVDHKAIREQEDNVADLELDATISALEKEQELLDDILEQLDETEQKWQDIASVFENNKALDKAKELLGDNFQNIIIEGDESSINDILNSYINAQEKLEENALVIEDYEKRIEELEAIAEKWESAANIKQETENAINASELLGKQWQEDILADKQSTYENFCDNYLAIQSKIEDNTTLIESYNQKVEYYENLKEQWQDITDAYTVAQEDLSLVQMLGANAEADILSGRLDVLENFKSEYLNIQAQIEDNTLLIESYEEKVEYYENLKQQWADIADAYKNAEEDMYLTQVLGTNAEADLLSGRLDVLEDFKSKYAEIEQALVDIAWNSANEQNKALASVGSGSTNGSGNIDLGNGADVPDVPTDSTETNAPSNTRTVYEIIDANGESFGTYNSPEEAHSVAKRLVNSGEAERPYKIGEIDLPELIEKKKGSGGGSISKNTMAQVFHDGIKKGYPDTSMPKDKKVELLEKLATKEISLDSDEVPVIARKGEIFLNSPQQSMLAMNYERLLELTGSIPWNVPVVNSNPFANVNTAERGQTTNVSFGTINMYEVNNVRDFAAELDKYSPNIAVQYNGRHRR